MTSKEYIEEHLNQLKKDFDIAIKENLKEYANKLVEDIKQSESIKKDLEVLEILKKYNSLSLDCYEAITYGLLGKGYSAFYKFCEKMLETDEDEIPSENEFNLIKNWLERKE